MASGVLADTRMQPAPPDDLDRLVDYDNAVADFLKDLPLDDTKAAQPGTRAPAVTTADEDQEVQVRKQRKPIAKLDEDRLLSNAGIMKLRKAAKTQLKFRGKGHEMKDISTLLNMYQLWLDDLYPRAKFRDALTMVEKVGHRKRMQVMRKAWLDETKLGGKEASPERDSSSRVEDGTQANPASRSVRDAEDESIFRSNDTRASDSIPDVPPEGEVDSLLAEESQGAQSRHSKSQPNRSGPFEDDMPDDDDLDALLAEESAPAPQPNRDEPPRASRSFLTDMPDDDDLDALLAEHE